MKTIQVVIVQRRMVHYRIEFFDLLRAKLALSNIQLRVLYGNGTESELRRNDEKPLVWGEFIACYYFFRGKICIQNFPSRLQGADLVVVTQENKLLFNYFYHFYPRRSLIAYWGHGKNLQGMPGDRIWFGIKKFFSSRVDWWFAYTEMSRSIVQNEIGYDANKITVLNNSIAVKLDRAHYAQRKDVINTRLAFVGSLEKVKNIDFLLDSFEMMLQKRPDLELLIIGDGNEAPKVRQFVEKYPANSKWFGSLKGEEKYDVLRTASLILNPGMVGLNIIDSFAMGLPLVTADCGVHSPEIAYGIHGDNIWISKFDILSYSHDVLSLIDNAELLSKLSRGCLRASEYYTLEAMVNNFASGILASLGVKG